MAEDSLTPGQRASPVQMVVGDLLAQPDVDALVNPWNRNFVPRHLLIAGGVSGQLKKVTGPGPWKELARHGLLPVGGVVITEGGRLPQRLIHVAGLTATWRATPAGVRRSASNAVRAAHAAGISSLAMPLIGAGHGRLSAAQSLTAILEGVADAEELARRVRVRVVVRPADAAVVGEFSGR